MPSRRTNTAVARSVGAKREAKQAEQKEIDDEEKKIEEEEKKKAEEWAIALRKLSEVVLEHARSSTTTTTTTATTVTTTTTTTVEAPFAPWDYWGA